MEDIEKTDKMVEKRIVEVKKIISAVEKQGADDKLLVTRNINMVKKHMENMRKQLDIQQENAQMNVQTLIAQQRNEMRILQDEIF